MYERQVLVDKTKEYFNECVLMNRQPTITGLCEVLSVSHTTIWHYRKGYWGFNNKYNVKHIASNRCVMNDDFEIIIGATEKILDGKEKRYYGT